MSYQLTDELTIKLFKKFSICCKTAYRYFSFFVKINAKY